MLTKSQERKLEKILTKAQQDEDILAVLIYGSRARENQKATPDSDLDICLVLHERNKEASNKDPTFISRKRLEYLSAIDPKKIDIQIFQQLPIYVKKRILEEGELKYRRDRAKLYELAYRTIQEYENFAPRLKEYLEGVKYG
ncbi:aminoglycoside 6-adenylyltransferase [Candidatus Bipolaricaulota bacterium]|nr:aminoglycoside 6-adenylyltransferase [Candidatus Bipolaricaulota bacterium]MBS3793230.1 aminoglycoside 6-adenylyltransferase [Candidatus Bipolaricaulota bacterium]